MSEAVAPARAYPVRMLPKDLGVALVVLAALALGLLLRSQVEGATTTFQDPNSPFRIGYPRSWTAAGALDVPAGTLLRVENPRTDSAFKTTLSVESRELDPGSPPTLQELIDRRVEQHGELEAYRLLSNDPATVAGAKGAKLEWAYVAQPIDAPRRYSLPVVVRAREYILVAKDRTYYLTLAAPENEWDDASARFDRMIRGVRVQ